VLHLFLEKNSWCDLELPVFSMTDWLLASCWMVRRAVLWCSAKWVQVLY